MPNVLNIFNLQDYDFDEDAITEATPDDLKPQEEKPHRLTINLSDDPTFCYCSDKSSLTSDVAVCEPVAPPRKKSNSPNSIPPEPPSASPPPWSPIKDCCDEKPVHETTKCPFELDSTPSEFTEQPTTSASSAAPSDPTVDDEPPYPANEQQVIHDQIRKNRMYANTSSSSSSSECDSDEPNEFELESLQTTDRQHKKEDEYSILNEETDKSNAG